MRIPVTRDIENEEEIIMLDLQDVLFIHLEDRSIVYHTQNEQFYHLMSSLTVMSDQTKPLGFRKLDRINLVNMRKIKHFDEDHCKVFFEDPSSISKESKFATVSFIHKGKRKREIREWVRKNAPDNTF